MNKYYAIAGLKLDIDIPDDFQLPEPMKLFEIPGLGNTETDCSFQIRYFDAEKDENLLKKIQKSWEDGECFQRRNLTVYVKGGKECRFIFFEGDTMPYAVSCEYDVDKTEVYVSYKYQEMFRYETIFTSLLSLERHLLRKNAMILHSAYICQNEQAILFSAPSGTGKSTQAGLWEKYRNSRQINGDDSVLKKHDGTWYANGFPVCGSSQVCHNESYRIKAIVMLYQAEQNIIRRLRPIEAFSGLFPQIKVNMWNSIYQEQAISLMESLIGEVPVLEMGCNISEAAVICLEEMLNTL